MLIDVSENRLAQLTALGEGFTTEFKRSVPSNLGAEVCAFANATGGVILIGVTDDGDVVGVGSHNRLKSQVQTTARSADPPIAVEVESVGDVLIVRVPEQHGKPYSFGGRFYIREGSNCQQMSRDEIRESFYKEGLIRFDETPCPRFDLQHDLTPEAWSRFAARARIPDELEPLIALENLHLVRDGQMTYAGAWLLAEDITKYSLQAVVTCALLRGVTKTHILDLKNFTGDLYSVYEDCVAYAQAKLNTALIPHIHGRDERLELPEDAIREALVNAIAHRDYRSTANVQMYLFHDRLEIVTPGRFARGDAGGRPGDQERTAQSPAVRHVPPHGHGGADRQWDPAHSPGVPRLRCRRAADGGFRAVGDYHLQTSGVLDRRTGRVRDDAARS